MKGNVIKRIWAWIMVACMLFTMVPAFAEEDGAVTDTAEAEVVATAEPTPAAEPETASAEEAAPVEETPEVTPEPEATPEPEDAADDEGSTDETADAPTDEPTDVPTEAPSDDAATEPTEGEATPEPEEDAAPDTDAADTTPAEDPDVVDDGIADKDARECDPGQHVYDVDHPLRTVDPGDCSRTDRPATVVVQCTKCGAQAEMEVPAKHSYGPYTMPRDCERPERSGQICSKCGAEDPAHPLTDYTGTDPRKLPTGHNVTHKIEKANAEGKYTVDSDPRIKAANCTEAGVEVWECSNLGCKYGPSLGKDEDGNDIPSPYREVRNIDPLGHDYSKDNRKYVAPTCEKPARYLTTCPRCGSTVEEVCNDSNKAPALGHKFRDDPRPFYGGRDDKKVMRHYVVCTRDQQCDYWNEGWGEARKYEECSVDITTTKATCAHGNLTSYKCKVCLGRETDDDGKLDMDNHDPAYITPYQDAAYTKPLGNDYLKNIVCETTYTAYLKCTNPAHHESDAAKLGSRVWTQRHSFVAQTDDGRQIPVDQDLLEEEWYLNKLLSDLGKQQSCYEDIVVEVHCTRDACNVAGGYKHQIIYPANPTLHNWTKASVEIPATCTDNAKRVIFCENPRCPAYKVTYEVPNSALGHDYLDPRGGYVYNTHLIGEDGQTSVESPGNPNSLTELWNSSGAARGEERDYFKRPSCTENGWVILRCHRTGINMPDFKNMTSIDDYDANLVPWTCTEDEEVNHELKVDLLSSGHQADPKNPPNDRVHMQRDCLNPERDVVLCMYCRQEIPELTVVTPGGKPASGHKWEDTSHSADGWVPDKNNTPFDEDINNPKSAQNQIDKAKDQKHSRKCVNPWCTGINGPDGTGLTGSHTNGKTETKKCNFKEKNVGPNCTFGSRYILECEDCHQKLFLRYGDQGKVPTGHIKPTSYKTVTRETCNKPGIGEYRCTVCQTLLDTVEIPAKHVWKQMTLANTDPSVHNDLTQPNGKYAPAAATCNTAGSHWEICVRGLDEDEDNQKLGEHETKSTICTDCGTLFVKGSDGKNRAIRYVVDPPTKDHKWKKFEMLPATCVDDARSNGYMCQDCGIVDPDRPGTAVPNSALGHLRPAQGVEAVAAGCETPGRMDYYCTRKVYLTDEEAEKAEKGEKVTPWWTCTEEKPQWQETIPPTGHEPGLPMRLPADCINDERIATRCLKCNQEISVTYPEGGEKHRGHQWIGDWYYLGEGKHARKCAVCGVDPATGKNVFDCNKTNPRTVTANCTYPAGTMYTCNVCGHDIFEAAPGNTGVAPDVHVWEIQPVKTDDKDYTESCTGTGVGQQVCKYCGAKGEYVAIKRDHHWNAGVVTVEATCTKDGVRTLTCENPKCDSIRTTGKPATKTVAIPATGHAWGKVMVNKRATCVAPGEETRICLLCGERNTAPTPLADHNYTTVATKDDNGNAMINYCLQCGEPKFVSWIEGIPAANKDCTKVSKTLNGVTKTLQHTVVDMPEIRPTPAKPGHEAGKYCTVCEKYLDNSQEIPWPGVCDDDAHVWEKDPETTVAATCTKDGVNGFVCSVCGSKKTEKAPALGHTWQRDGFDVNDPANQTEANGWVVDVASTTEATGTGHFECTDPNCDAETKPAKSGDVVIPKHVHTYVPVRYKRSTEDRMRKIAHVTCSGCEETWDVEMGIDDPFDPSMIKE